MALDQEMAANQSARLQAASHRAEELRGGLEQYRSRLNESWTGPEAAQLCVNVEQLRAQAAALAAAL